MSRTRRGLDRSPAVSDPYRLVLAALVLCAILAFGRAAGADADPAQRTVTDAQGVGEAQSLAEAERKLARLERYRRTPEARKQRRRSRKAFADLTGARAVDFGSKAFRSALAAPVSPGLRLSQGERVDQYLGAFAARVDNPGAQPDEIVESTVPLRAPTENGEMAPLRLSLEKQGDHFESRNPAVGVSYAKDPNRGVLLRDAGVGVSLAGVRMGAIGRAENDRYVVSDALTDTDLWFRPMPAGFQTFAVLRSSASPQALAFNLDLPASAKLESAPAGTAIVTKGGDPLVSISAPIAMDADGVPVPVSMHVSGSQMTLGVEHRSREIRYPILVDPTFSAIESWNWFEKEWFDEHEPEDEGWYPQTNQSGAFDAEALYLPGRWGGGLYTFTHVGATVNAGAWSDWILNPPGNTKVTVADLLFSSNSLNGCWMVGIGDSGPVTSGCEAVNLKRVSSCVNPCSAEGGTAANYAVFRLTSSTTGKREQSNKLIGAIAEANIHYSDYDEPDFSAVNKGGSGTTWVKSYSGEVKGAVQDNGVGLRYNTVEVTGQGGFGGRFAGCSGTAESPCWSEEYWIGCEGTTRQPCAQSLPTDYPIASSEIDDGKHKVVVYAEDGVEQESAHAWGDIWLDRAGPALTFSGSLWDNSDKTDAAGNPQNPPPTLPWSVYNLKVNAADGVLGGSESEQRSGTKSVEIKLDGEVVLPPDSVSCPGGSCPDVREWSVNTANLDGGEHTVTAIALDQMGNQSVRSFHIKLPPTGALDSPQPGTKTSRWLQLKAHAEDPTYTKVRFEYKKAGGTWANIPLGSLRDRAGQPLGSIEQPLTGSYSPEINWEVAKTFTPPLTAKSDLQVKAFFTGSSAGSSKAVRVTLEPKGMATDDAREGIGPGEVNLATGNFGISATDASVASWATAASVSRAFNSRDPGSNANGPFGPGWTMSVPVEEASEFSSLRKAVDVYGGEFAELKTTGGGSIFFYLEAGKYVPEVGYETMTLTAPGANEFVFKDAGGNVIVFKKEAGTTGDLYVPKSIQQPGSANASSVEYEVVAGVPRVKSVLAPVPPGVTCTAPSFNTAGCRSMKLIYATATTATGTGETEWGSYKDRVEKIEFTAYDPGTSAMKSDIVSQYLYDNAGRLRAQWDPRIASALKTRYSYDAGGRLSMITPPGENTWVFAYSELPGDGDGGRLKSVSRSTPQGTATTTVVYQVPLSGATAPYKMAPSSVAAWDQKEFPAGATAIFPPDTVPAEPPSTYTRATIHYLGYGGREVNVAATGAGISTSEYDVYGNVIRELSPANRQRAIEAGSESVAVSQKLDTERSFDPLSKGTEMKEEIGPEHQIKLPNGETVRARARTTIKYDEGAPAEKDPHLPTTTTVQAKVTGGSESADARVTKTEYDWTLLKPTRTVKDYGGLNIAESTVYSPTTGLVELTYKPKFQKPVGGGLDSPDRVYRYYTAGTNVSLPACGNRPDVANKLCRMSPYAAGHDLPVTFYDYNRLHEPTTTTEEIEDRVRTKTRTYDAAGRELTSRVSTSTDREGLVAAYGFEESTGTTTADKSGNNNTGTLANVTRVAQGRFGRALDFDSSADKVTVPDSSSLHISSSVTLEAWVRPDVSGTLQKIIEKPGTSCTSPAFGLTASVSASEPGPRATSCGTHLTAASSYKLPVGLWSHLAVTIDSAHKTKIYVNGEQIASGTITGTVSSSTAAMLLGPGFDGLIDEVRIYNRAISQPEVHSDMTAAVDSEAAPLTYSKRAGLLASYGFEELDKTTAFVDSSGNGNDGALSDDELHAPGGRAGQGLDPGWQESEDAEVKFKTPLKVASAVTIEMWLKPHEILGYNRTILVLGSYSLRAGVGGGLSFTAGGKKGETWEEVLTPGKAHFIAATYNGSMLQAYVDGAPVLFQTTTPGGTKDAESLYLPLIHGITDEIRIYNKVLTQTEIQEDGLVPIAAPKSTITNGTKLPTVTTGYSSSTGRPINTVSTEAGVTKNLFTTYDAVGRVISYKDADGITSTTQYDIDGRPTEVFDGKGTQTYGYDSETGQLETLVDSQAGTFSAEYDLTGRLINQTYPNGMKAAMSYDETGTPIGLTYTKSGCGTCVWYEQDIVESIRGQWVTNNTTVAGHSYTYDGIGRLTLAKETPAGKGCTTREYTYDADSNRLSKTTRAPGAEGACVTTGGGTTQTSTYDNGDRIVDSGFVYDMWGRLTKVPSSHSGGGELSMSYYVNDMTRTSTQDGKTVGWLLDPTQTRQRATITSENKQTIYHYSDGSDSPAWTANFTGAALTSWQRNVGSIDGSLGALVSFNGSTTTPTLQMSNLHGDIVGTATTSPEATKPTELFEADEFGLPGEGPAHEYGWLGDKERRSTLASGLVQMGIRSYVPAMGRFTSVDPIYGGSANTYDYALQDPVNQSDLSGEYSGVLGNVTSFVSEGFSVAMGAGNAHMKAELEGFDSRGCPRSVARKLLRGVKSTGRLFAACAIGDAVQYVRTMKWWEEVVQGVKVFGHEVDCAWTGRLDDPSCKKYDGGGYPGQRRSCRPGSRGCANVPRPRRRG